MRRYRFRDFTLSPQRRLLIRAGSPVPIIPRYFDLLVLLVERRHEAVHKREIFERVWADGFVSDSALTQAIRTLRRTLGDEPREPVFIRTVSRHGYQFVFPDVVEEDEDGPAAIGAAPAGASTSTPGPTVDGPIVERRIDVPIREEQPAGTTLLRAAVAAARGALGGTAAGVAAGAIGGLVLSLAPDSLAPLGLAPVLAVIGAASGALGGAGVGAGLTVGSAWAHRRSALALIPAGAAGGGLVGFLVQWLVTHALGTIVGLELAVGGGVEGLMIGGGAGFGAALATLPSSDGLALPPGGTRVRTAVVVAGCCGLAALALALAGRPLVGGTIHLIADAADGSRASLAPLGRLMGEPDFGLVTSAILGFGEGAAFGFGLALALLRPKQAPIETAAP